MFAVKMDIENVVAAFVETMLPRFSDPKTVLVMSFELRVSKIGINYPECKPQARTAHLMFWRPNNYTKVFWNIQKKWKPYRECKTWNLECNHDSGWRTDGVDTPFSKLAEEIAKKNSRNSCYPDVDVSINFKQEPKLVTATKFDYSSEKQNAIVEFTKE